MIVQNKRKTLYFGVYNVYSYITYNNCSLTDGAGSGVYTCKILTFYVNWHNINS